MSVKSYMRTAVATFALVATAGVLLAGTRTIPSMTAPTPVATTTLTASAPEAVDMSNWHEVLTGPTRRVSVALP